MLAEQAGFFVKNGYQPTATTQNLECAAAAGGAPLKSDRREDVLRFIEKHFGPVWRFEASKGATIFHVEARREIAASRPTTPITAASALGRGCGREARGRGFGRQLLLASIEKIARTVTAG